MLLYDYYRSDLLEHIQNTNPAELQRHGLSQDQILKDEDAILILWNHYQSNILDQNMTPEDAYKAAIQARYHADIVYPLA